MKYADLIRAVLDDKQIEYKMIGPALPSGWVLYTNTNKAAAISWLSSPTCQHENSCYEVRLYTPPPPDIITYDYIRPTKFGSLGVAQAAMGSFRNSYKAIRMVTDGTTGKLKSVEIVE